MGALKDAGIRSLQHNLASYEQSTKDEENQENSSLEDAFKAYLNTNSKAQREKLLKEFAARRIEFVEYLRAHPELLAAETQTALIFAALGGKTSELETITDAHGRKTRKRKTRQAAPNMAALERLLDSIGDAGADTDNSFVEAIEKAGDDVWRPE